ncbi:hypothetical protein AC529_17175 [Thermobifida cellulosilytica TB100]|uniref:Tetratricopeptide repeat protein n=1 Tax=Thermobifida cellulosilytica TB100 TaxID=665004 RepID=A0A147KE28_THECS|nr:hypothetical protein AC529_17175 [Thermobifida cellulosilytica TB100]
MEANRERPSVDELLEAVDAVWNDVDRLRALVHGALDAGFGPEVLPAAERVRVLDPDLDRGVVLYAQALSACGRDDRAEEELVRHIRARGGHADTWFALAGLADRRDDDEDVATALDQALRCDPDHADALVWGWRRHAERHGPQQADAWLAELAPGSWRATVMLGERVLYRDDVAQAVELFGAACARAGRRGEALRRAARALAARGHDAECVALVTAHWSASHGPLPLVEAIEAQLRLGRVSEAVLGLARLRGLRDAEDHPEVADLYRRVEHLRAQHGL